MTDICRLDYLIGTIATAYKGVITSLVIKDFCIAEEAGGDVIKGTVLSMPQGDYLASLIKEGGELSRAALRAGYFELTTKSGQVSGAANLQIDIIQNGRHIGTFLLKREKTDRYFAPAMELSKELEGLPLRSLTTGLDEKPGLLNKAEAIVSEIVSSKKDWARLSENINSFSRDLYWSSRETYYGCYEILVRYGLNSCLRVEEGTRVRAISNLLSLLELPLEQEENGERLRSLAETWIRGLQGSGIDLSLRFTQAKNVITGISRRLPGVDILPVLNPLLMSVKQRAKASSGIGNDMLEQLRGIADAREMEQISLYGERGRKALLRQIDALQAPEADTDREGLLQKLAAIDTNGLDDAGMADSVLTVLERHLSPETGPLLFPMIHELLSMPGSLSPDARKALALHTSRLIRKSGISGLTGICEALLQKAGNEDPWLRDEVVLNPEVASAILRTGSSRLLEVYARLLMKIIVPAPRVTGFSDETWAEIINPFHLRRLGGLLSVIGLDQERFRDVLVHLICNLYLSGVFIPDDRLFQRQVSAYLNTPGMEENFLLNTLLLRKLPVYYNEVAATGRIREHTTDLDSWGNDSLLYFLRKQTHVNASNNNVGLVSRIISAWVNGTPEALKESVPRDIYEKIDPLTFRQYGTVMRELFGAAGMTGVEGMNPDRLLAVSEPGLRRMLAGITAPEEVRAKVLLICLIYRELVRKYSFAAGPAEADFNSISTERLQQDLHRVRHLREIICSPVKTEPEESLYFKRHIAFGIPSVMGTYREPKLDALGEMLRIEEGLRVVFENVVTEIGKKAAPSAEALPKWLSFLDAMHGLVDLHGLGNFQITEVLEILKTNRLHRSQVADLLRIWQKEVTWAVMFFHRTFHDPLVRLLREFPEEDLPVRLKNLVPGSDIRDTDFINKAADSIIREMVTGIPGLTEGDRMIEAMIAAMKEKEELVQGGEIPEVIPGKMPAYLLIGVEADKGDEEIMSLAPELGGKAKNLFYLCNRGLPVPAGAVFFSGHTPDYAAYTAGEEFLAALRSAVNEIGELTGSRLGDREKPLFLSVRSGSYISMPGILSSVLYCGMNRTTVAGLMEITGSAWTGWDSYRRFIEHYATIVLGLDIGILDTIRDSGLKGRGINTLHEAGAEGMEQIVGMYLEALAGRGLVIPEDPQQQLQQAVRAVYGSWYGPRARHFREAMGVSEHWGTAVILMQMVCGNVAGSGASVFFTRIPPWFEKGIYGDTREAATGDDLVSGQLMSRPLSKMQAMEGQASLEETDPALYARHVELASKVEEAMRGLPQEVEATYVRVPGGERIIYLLQTKRMEFHRGFVKRFDDICDMKSHVLGRGVGVHGGALSGVAALSSSREEIGKIRASTGMPIILLRNAASTDDVSLMDLVDGIVTASGGATSHAAILAQKFRLTAVVGCRELKIRETGEARSATVGDYPLSDGTAISIDGSAGLIYSGECQLTTETGNGD